MTFSLCCRLRFHSATEAKVFRCAKTPSRSLAKNLRELGYRLLVSADLEDAFEWASGSEYIHADLMLMDLSGKLPEESLSIGRRLREHCKAKRRKAGRNTAFR